MNLYIKRKVPFELYEINVLKADDEQLATNKPRTRNRPKPS